jgi:hypothetical protein
MAMRMMEALVEAMTMEATTTTATHMVLRKVGALMGTEMQAAMMKTSRH